MYLPTRGTPYDLRFSLFGIPVTISPFFWVTAALFGWPWLQREPGGPANLLAWIVCVLVSLLVHEFGHALTMRLFGHRPEVVLHHFGGYATYRGRETPGKSLLITAAGPAAQLVFFAVVLVGSLWTVRDTVAWSRLVSPEILPVLYRAVPELLVGTGAFERDTPLYAVVDSLLFINFYWPLLNLIPVLPLDGGRLLQSSLAIARVPRGDEWTLRIGMVVGALAAVYFLFGSNFIAGAMFAMMAADNYQSLSGQREGTPYGGP